jgi:hypothetical protein
MKAMQLNTTPMQTSTANASPRVLSLIPPMTQLNTPYPSTAYITGFLRSPQSPPCRKTWPCNWCCGCSPSPACKRAPAD